MNFSTDHLDYLSRSYLDKYKGIIKSLTISDDLHVPPIHSLRFSRVNEISRFWKEDQSKKNNEEKFYRTGDILAACAGTNTPVIYLVEGDGTNINVNLGTCEPLLASNVDWNADAAQSIIKKLFSSQYPGIQFSANQSHVPGFTWKNNDPSFFGLLTGIPTYKKSEENDRITQMDILIRSMTGQKWGLIVIAQPLTSAHATNLYNQIVNEERQVKDEQSESPLAEKYFELLEYLSEAFQEGLSTGLWTCSTYYYAADRNTFNCLSAAMTNSFGGYQSLPDPIRTIECEALSNIVPNFTQILMKSDQPPGNFEYPYNFQTLLSSLHLSSMLHLPCQEMPGYIVQDSTRLDVAIHQNRSDATIRLGDVLDRKQVLNYDYPLSPAMLNKHTLVVGVTGSGKSYTCRFLLKQLWQQKIPFLVIEPAKKEYRDMLKDPDIGKDIAVFTLGNELETPFRLNPFECESHVPISSHIDLLKSVFNAAFSMWTVLPQILEQSLHEVYKDYGWDVVRNTNRRLEKGEIDRREAFPTLTDLQQTIGIVVDRLAYSTDSTKELKAALVTRIQSLRIGGKGKMLDTRESFPMETLLSKPIIFELEDIGDDDEKAFIMALLLSKIYEHLRGQKESKKLKGLVVIEEAHRLLSNVPQQASSDVSNTKGKAVETFVNMLSEVRAYGQGFMIAEQIPSKLAPDVIKNTNVKIIHRTVAGDDRQLIGQTINLEDKKNNILALLTVGQAIVFSEGDDRPIMVAVDNRKNENVQVSKKINTPMLLDVRTQISKRFPKVTYDCLAHCKRYMPEKSFDCDLAQEIAEKEEIQKVFSYYLLSVLEEPKCIVDELKKVLIQIDRHRPGLIKDDDMTRSILIHGISHHLKILGNLYGWSFGGIDKLTRLLIPIILDVFIVIHTSEGNSPISIHNYEQLKIYKQEYIKLCERQFDPFPFCKDICDKEPKSCLYRYHTKALIDDDNLDFYFIKSLNNSKNDEIMIANLNQLVKDAFNQCASEMIPVESQWKIGRCFVMQKIDALADRSVIEKNEILKMLVSYTW